MSEPKVQKIPHGTSSYTNPTTSSMSVEDKFTSALVRIGNIARSAYRYFMGLDVDAKEKELTKYYGYGESVYNEPKKQDRLLKFYSEEFLKAARRGGGKERGLYEMAMGIPEALERASGYLHVGSDPVTFSMTEAKEQESKTKQTTPIQQTPPATALAAASPSLERDIKIAQDAVLKTQQRVNDALELMKLYQAKADEVMEQLLTLKPDTGVTVPTYEEKPPPKFEDVIHKSTGNPIIDGLRLVTKYMTPAIMAMTALISPNDYGVRANMAVAAWNAINKGDMEEYQRQLLEWKNAVEADRNKFNYRMKILSLEAQSKLEAAKADRETKKSLLDYYNKKVQSQLGIFKELQANLRKMEELSNRLRIAEIEAYSRIEAAKQGAQTNLQVLADFLNQTGKTGTTTFKPK